VTDEREPVVTDPRQALESLVKAARLGRPAWEGRVVEDFAGVVRRALPEHPARSGEEAFRAAILPWVQEYRREQGVRVVEVTSVKTDGNDWAGSTEDGWHSTAETRLDLVLEDEKGSWPSTLTIDGEGMADLWGWVVQNWPTS
jgi:hypothetical protein